MLIIALVLALIGLVALVFAVVTSNELVAWVCIGASVLGVVLLIVDALRERQRRESATKATKKRPTKNPRRRRDSSTTPKKPRTKRRGHQRRRNVGAEPRPKESTVPADSRSDDRPSSAAPSRGLSWSACSAVRAPHRR